MAVALHSSSVPVGYAPRMPCRRTIDCQVPGLMEASNSLSRLLGEGGASVLGLVLDRRDEADLPVEPAEVEPVDVLGDGDFEVVDVLPGSAVADQFGFEQ